MVFFSSGWIRLTVLDTSPPLLVLAPVRLGAVIRVVVLPAQPEAVVGRVELPRPRHDVVVELQSPGGSSLPRGIGRLPLLGLVVAAVESTGSLLPSRLRRRGMPTGAIHTLCSSRI